MYSSHVIVLLAQQFWGNSSAIERELFLCKETNSDGAGHLHVLTASCTCSVKENS